MEAPQYSVKPKIARAVVPEFLKLLMLCAIFYIGILINLSLLNFPIPLSINLLVIAVLLILITLEMVLIYVKSSRTTYQFYSDHVSIAAAAERQLPYPQITSPRIKRTVFDRMYNTGTIILQPKFKLSSVENPDEIFSYLQNMMAYQAGKGL